MSSPWKTAMSPQKFLSLPESFSRRPAPTNLPQLLPRPGPPAAARHERVARRPRPKATPHTASPHPTHLRYHRLRATRSMGVCRAIFDRSFRPDRRPRRRRSVAGPRPHSAQDRRRGAQERLRQGRRQILAGRQHLRLRHRLRRQAGHRLHRHLHDRQAMHRAGDRRPAAALGGRCAGEAGTALGLRSSPRPSRRSLRELRRVLVRH